MINVKFMIQKTKVLTLIVFGLLFINLSAQDGNFENDPNAKLPDEDRKFRFGLQFSPHVSWFKTNTDGYESAGTQIGFSVGPVFEYFLSKNYLFSTGFTILNSGGDVKFKSGVVYDRTAQGLPNLYFLSEVEQKYSLKYIELPLLLKLRTNEIGYLTYFGQFGFKVGFNYGSTIEETHSYYDEVAQIEKTITDKIGNASGSVNFLNMSLVIGAGVEYSISGNTSLMLGLTFNNGFISQLDTDVIAYDANGNSFLDSSGNPVLLNKDVSANLNYISLNIGIFF